MARYVLGTLVTVQGEFYSTANVPTDPDSVTCKYSPAGTEDVTTIDTTKVSTGVYTADIDTTAMSAGIVIYEFIGTGACQTGGQDQFELARLPF